MDEEDDTDDGDGETEDTWLVDEAEHIYEDMARSVEVFMNESNVRVRSRNADFVFVIAVATDVAKSHVTGESSSFPTATL
jgi:hypothetical protein